VQTNPAQTLEIQAFLRSVRPLRSRTAPVLLIVALVVLGGAGTTLTIGALSVFGSYFEGY
jgi:hypothetical protein